MFSRSPTHPPSVSDNYYLSFPNDRLFWKVLVYLVLFAELIQTILATIDAFRIFSSGWGKFQLLDDLNLLFLTPVMSASSEFFVGGSLFKLSIGLPFFWTDSG